MLAASMATTRLEPMAISTHQLPSSTLPAENPRDVPWTPRMASPSKEAIDPSTTIPVMTTADRWTFRLLVSLWLLAVSGFIVWWFQPVHIGDPARFALTSAVVGYALALPAYFFFFLSRMRRPDPALVLPPGRRVTFVTTCVPGAEPIDVLERTIVAMVNQEGYPHDVWVLDEGDLPEVRVLCARVGAYHFSRRHRPEYQRSVWPFKAKTKAGNYNAWLDWLRTEGIEYDIILQMDTDHVPQPGYMEAMLRPFADDAVNYVAAPSIVSGNREESWVVAGRYELESTLHGPLQSGYNAGYAPLIIGSHAAFRVSALRRIGGFQHTLAEDHHNTLRLQAGGMRGVFQPDAIAIGDGAACFTDAMIQEYQWSRALTQILLNFFPKDGRTLSPRLWLQFAFAETWYPIFALTQLVGWLMPVIALLTGEPWVRVNYFQFLGMSSLVTLTTLAVVAWVRWRGWLRPQDASIVSWRTTLLMLARWPYVLIGVVEAAYGVVTRKDFPFRVTPKGAGRRRDLPFHMVFPYLLLSGVSLVAAGRYLAKENSSGADGYLYLALLNAGVYVLLVVALTVLNIRENLRAGHVTFPSLARRYTPVVLPVALSIALLLPLAAWSGDRIQQALFWSSPILDPTETQAAPRSTEAGSAALPGEPTSEPAADPSVTPGPDSSIVVELTEHPGTAGDQAASVEPTGTEKVVIQPEAPFVGIYDPAGLVTIDGVAAEQVFVQWSPNAGADVDQRIEQILAKGRLPIIAVEPWPWGIEGLTQETLLADIAAGRYDQTIREIAASIRVHSPQPVYIRFGHEMDLTDIFPWAQGDPKAFIAAYRHVVNVAEAEGASNARWVWSPTGNRGSADYYPGNDVVDMIGVTILVAGPWEADAGILNPRSFRMLLSEKYGLSAQFNKPMLALEVGVSLDDDARELQWIEDARAAISDYPMLHGIIYFNDQNPPVIRVQYLPDWRLTTRQAEALFGAGDAPR